MLVLIYFLCGCGTWAACAVGGTLKEQEWWFKLFLSITWPMLLTALLMGYLIQEHGELEG